MINSALSNTLNVSELVPKAETKLHSSGTGEGAFGEALAGAHSVHDRRESQAAPHSRREWARGDHAAERTRGTERAAEVRSDRATRSTGDDTHAADADGTDATAAVDTDAHADASISGDDTTGSIDHDTDAASETATAAAVEVDAEAGTSTTATATAGATIAVAAAPVLTDLDAIVLPTIGTTTSVATDAVDAAMRLAIDADATVSTTAATGATTATVAATTTATTDAAPATQAATIEVDATLATSVTPGAEDAAAGDVEAGPTRPTTSTPAATSGPSPATNGELAIDAGAALDATSTVSTRQVAMSASTEVAAGVTTDADAQLVQAAAVSIAGDTEAVPATSATTTTTTVAASATATATAAAAAGEDAAAPADVAVTVDADATEANTGQGNRPATVTPGPSANAAAQAQVAAQAGAAHAAEAGPDEAADTAAPTGKAEPLPTQASSVATAARTEPQGQGTRVRGEFAQVALQERIDHIADQLATRLRLSQAAGGSHVQLSLKPRELGEVTVQMNVRDGAVAATILVDKPDTLRTLQTNIEELKRSLENQGLSIGEFSVDVRGEAGAGGANARAAADNNRGSGRGSSNGSVAGVAGAMSATPGLSGDREVDPDELHDGSVSVLA
ncbi:MAG: flagellar hook-length control protein [Thermoleophilia bacterium]|nr:flagellar hook-length control protein [Thermoleophilia bacterium]